MFFQEECGDNNFTSVGRRKRAAVDVENDANMAEATFSLSFKDDRKSAQGMYIYTGWGLLCVLAGVGGKTRKILKVCTSTQGRAYWVCWRVWVGRQEEHSGYVHRVGLTGCVGGCGWEDKNTQGMYTGWSLLGVLAGVGGKTRRTLGVCTSTQGGAYWVCWRVWVGRQEEHSGYVHLHRVGLTGCAGGCGREDKNTAHGTFWACGALGRCG